MRATSSRTWRTDAELRFLWYVAMDGVAFDTLEDFQEEFLKLLKIFQLDKRGKISESNWPVESELTICVILLKVHS